MATLQPLVVSLETLPVVSTPFIPGVQPDPPLYTVETPFAPGLTPDDDLTYYAVSTPVIPGAELDFGAGTDDLDETYLSTSLSPPSITADLDITFLPTRISGPDHGLYHLDETYEPTTFTLPIDVSPITFFPARRSSVVQPLTAALNPGPDQNVIFGAVR